MHYEKEEYRSAINKLNDLLIIEPNNLSALKRISECYFKIKSYNDSLRVCKVILTLEPNSYSIYSRIGSSYRALKNYQLALKYQMKSHLLRPDDFENVVNVALVYFDLKEYDQAIVYWLKAHSLQPNDVSTLVNIGRSYNLLERNEEAIGFYMAAIDIKPDHAKYLAELGSIYSKLSDNSNALKYCEKAYNLSSRDIDVAFKYARVLFENRKYVYAEPIFVQVANSDSVPDYEDLSRLSYGNLGHIELFRNNVEMAMYFYRKCVLGFEDIEDFEKRFDNDFFYFIDNKIEEVKYYKIKTELADYWKNHKHKGS